MNENQSMFEKAARLKLRFQSPKGLLSVEDLFDLPLTSQTGKTNLDDIARTLHSQVKSDDNISFVTPAQKASEELVLAFEIVKHVITTKIAERDAAAEAKAKADKKQKIMNLIEQKKDDALSAQSIDELMAQLNAL